MPTQATVKKTDLARLLRVAGEKNRLNILCLIFGDDKICVSEIAKKLKMSVAAVSHHLQVMAENGLLKPERNGKEICYLFENSELSRDLRQLICKYIKR